VRSGDSPARLILVGLGRLDPPEILLDGIIRVHSVYPWFKEIGAGRRSTIDDVAARVSFTVETPFFARRT